MCQVHCQALHDDHDRPVRGYLAFLQSALLSNARVDQPIYHPGLGDWVPHDLPAQLDDVLPVDIDPQPPFALPSDAQAPRAQPTCLVQHSRAAGVGL